MFLLFGWLNLWRWLSVFRKIKIISLLLILTLTINQAYAQKFAIIGDFGFAEVDIDGLIDAENVANMIDTSGVEFIVTTGDNNYSGLNDPFTMDENIGQFYHEWMFPYNGSYGEGDPDGINRFFPAVGNHDWYEPPYGSGIQGHYDYYVLPGNERYYDFIWGNVHFFILSSYDGYSYKDGGNAEPDGWTSNSTQGQWLMDALANADPTHWKIVVTHFPPYSSGEHGSFTDARWPYKEWGAHIVISGHDHDYERLSVNNFPYIVNGLGGKSKHPFGTILTDFSLVRYSDQFGAMLVEAASSYISFYFYTESGTLIDSYEITTPNPVELAYFASTLNGDEVQLRWRTETELNNYGFHIERAAENSDWLALGFVEGHGNSNSPRQYTFSDSEIYETGNYYYRLKQTDNDGTFEYSDVVSVTVGVPVLYSLSSNYPNPFNPETRIDYTLPKQQNVSLRINNMLGELVEVLENEVKPAGTYTVTFDGSDLPSGIYFYRLKAENFVETKKMVLMK